MLSQISPFNAEKHKQARIAEDAKISANREISCLRNLFCRCVDWGKFDGTNPAKQSKGNQAGRLTKEPLTRLRFLSYEEEAALVSASTEPFGLMDYPAASLSADLESPSEAPALNLQPRVEMLS